MVVDPISAGLVITGLEYLYKAYQEGQRSRELLIKLQAADHFHVLATLGQHILALEVHEDTSFDQTLEEVLSCLEHSGNNVLLDLFDKQYDKAKRQCAAALQLCAFYHPVNVYRGFGACVHNDWAWPNLIEAGTDEVNSGKASKAGRHKWLGVGSVKYPPIPSANGQLRKVLTMQLLCCKASHQRLTEGSAAEEETNADLSLLEDWSREIANNGHPGPRGVQINEWCIPFAMQDSTYNCHRWNKALGAAKAGDMDPGRLLHAFLCQGHLDLNDDQLLVLVNGSAAESLARWFQGRPRFTHRVITWQDLDTRAFQKHISKPLKNMVGKYPLPKYFVVRQPEASERARVPPALANLASSPLVSRVTNLQFVKSGNAQQGTVADGCFGSTEQKSQYTPVRPNPATPGRITSSQVTSAQSTPIVVATEPSVQTQDTTSNVDVVSERFNAVATAADKLVKDKEDVADSTDIETDELAINDAVGVLASTAPQLSSDGKTTTWQWFKRGAKVAKPVIELFNDYSN